MKLIYQMRLEGLDLPIKIIVQPSDRIWIQSTTNLSTRQHQEAPEGFTSSNFLIMNLTGSDQKYIHKTKNWDQEKAIFPPRNYNARLTVFPRSQLKVHRYPSDYNPLDQGIIIHIGSNLLFIIILYLSVSKLIVRKVDFFPEMKGYLRINEGFLK